MHRAEAPYPRVPLSPLRAEEGNSLLEQAEPLEPVFRTSLGETLETGGELAGVPEEMGRWKEPDRAFSLPVLARTPGEHRVSRSVPGVNGEAPHRSRGARPSASGGVRRGYGLSALLAQSLESPASAREEPVGEMVHTAFSPELSPEGPVSQGEKTAPSREASGGAEPGVVYRLPPRLPAPPQKEEETGEDVLRAQSVDPGYVSAMNAAYSYQAPQSRPRPEIPGAISQEIEEQIVRQVLEDLNYNRMAAQVLDRVERRLRTERRKFGR